MSASLGFVLRLLSLRNILLVSAVVAAIFSVARQIFDLGFFVGIGLVSIFVLSTIRATLEVYLDKDGPEDA